MSVDIPAVMPPDILLVWHAHRDFHQTAGAIPSKAATKEIKAALKAGFTAEQLVAVVQWAHLAPHDRAQFLRGADYEAGKSSTGAYLGIVDLFRRDKLDNRTAWATEWVVAGSPNFRDAAPSAPPPDDPLLPALIAVLEDLTINQGDPDRCVDPRRARRALDRLYKVGGSIDRFSSTPAEWRAKAYRETAATMLRHAAAERAKAQATANG